MLWLEALSFLTGPMVRQLVNPMILDVGAYQLAVTAKASPQSELSDKSRKWLTMLARIKFQIEDAALEASRYQARDRKMP